MKALALFGASHTSREVAAGELFCCSAAHEHSQLTPDLIVKHEGSVLCLGRGVRKPQGTPTAGYDAELFHLQHMQNLRKQEEKNLCSRYHKNTTSLMSWLGGRELPWLGGAYPGGPGLPWQD